MIAPHIQAARESRTGYESFCARCGAEMAMEDCTAACKEAARREGVELAREGGRRHRTALQTEIALQAHQRVENENRGLHPDGCFWCGASHPSDGTCDEARTAGDEASR